MTHYGTLRALGVHRHARRGLRDDRRGHRHDRLGVRGRGLLADDRRPAHRTPRVHLHRDAPDRARARRCARSPTSATRVAPARRDGRGPPQELRPPDEVIEFPASDVQSSTSAISPSDAWSTSRAGAGRRTCSPSSAASGARRGTSGSSSPGVSGPSSPTARRPSSARATSSTSHPATTASRSATSPCVQVEWTGLRAWAGFPTGIHSRVLATLLFIGSRRLDDARRRARRRALARSSSPSSSRRSGASSSGSAGREVDTTGDGMLATFEGPARALHCAAALTGMPRSSSVQLRIGVHVGEVELVGADVRGIAVHEAARIMAAAAPGEILVSDLTRGLAGASGLQFEDRGHARAQGPRRRVAPRRLRLRAMSELPLILAVDEDARGARADHRRASALRARLRGRSAGRRPRPRSSSSRRCATTTPRSRSCSRLAELRS